MDELSVWVKKISCTAHWCSLLSSMCSRHDVLCTWTLAISHVAHWCSLLFHPCAVIIFLLSPGALGVWVGFLTTTGKKQSKVLPATLLQQRLFFVKLVKSSVERKAVWKNSSPSLSSVASGRMRSFSPHNTDYFLTSSNAQARYYCYYYYYYYYSSSSSFCPGLPLAFNRLL